MFDKLLPIVRLRPAQNRLLIAFFATFIMPAPSFANNITPNALQQLTFQTVALMPAPRSGLHSEIVHTLAPSTLMIVIASLAAGVIAILWGLFGPGAMARRKKARRELWLNAHAQQIHEQTLHQKYEKAAKTGHRPKDSDAFEREVRRWD